MLLEESQIKLIRPFAFGCNNLVEILDKHFHSIYKAEGASRLPVLAFYAVYECLMNEATRFKNKTLLQIESHTSADARSGRIGDIEIIDENKRVFEAIEIKHGITISLQLVLDAYAKFRTTAVKRYYILSTAPQVDTQEWDKIQAQVQGIKNVHGCQLIVNGVMPSLKYYLRLLNDPFEFIDRYVNLLETDIALKFEHKEKWNKIIGELS